MNEVSARGTLMVSSAEVCDRGKVREENQDNVRSARIPLGDLFIVADGIGGYQGGATASRMVVEGFLGQLASRAADYPPDRALREACAFTNASIFNTAGSSDPTLHRMGSTVVLVLLQLPQGGKQASGVLLNPGAQPVAWIGHVGDSRAYLIREGKMQKLTSDHSAVQSLLSRQLITEEEARNHPDASVLTRSLGHRPEVDLEIDRVDLRPGDGLLLCSDGLWGYVSDADIAAVVTDTSLSVQTVAETLLHQALAAGGQDNIGIEFARLSIAPVGAATGAASGAASGRVRGNPLPATIGSSGEPSAAQSTDKRLLKLQILAVCLLLLGGCGYLGYSAVSNNWFNVNGWFHKTSPVKPADIPPTPQADKPPARGKAAESKSAESGSGESKSGRTTIPAPAVPVNTQAGKHRGEKTVAVIGDLRVANHDLPASSATHTWKRVSITREDNQACVKDGKGRAMVYTSADVNTVEVLQDIPELGPHMKGVEQHRMTPDIRKDCGDFDVVLFLPDKQIKPGAQGKPASPGTPGAESPTSVSPSVSPGRPEGNESPQQEPRK